MLAKRPDEFALFLDINGFVKIKELLKAICEEDGWQYVRKTHINEILISVLNPPVEIKDDLIRAKDRSKLAKRIPAKNPPKLLYSFVRKRAYPHVLEKGIRPSGCQQVVMSANKDIVQRMGRRIDQSAVLLTINAQKTIEKGITFYQQGDLIYFAGLIPADCFSGPRPPKIKTSAKPVKQDEAKKEIKDPELPGSYLINMKSEEKDSRYLKQKNKKYRKKNIRISRKQKQKLWPE